MQTREKILAGAFGAMVIGWPLLNGIASWIMDPVTKAESRLSIIERKLDSVTEEEDVSLMKIRRMGEWKKRSLPGDTRLAKLVYQQWLTDLAVDVAKFREPKITPERSSPSKDKSFTTIRVTVAGQATMSQVREFLFRFYQADLMQSVASVTLENVDGPKVDNLNVRIAVEGLSLPDSYHEGNTLFPRGRLSSAEDGQLDLISARRFSELETPFLARVESQYVNVESIEGDKFILSEDAEKIRALKDAVVEYVPVAEAMQGKTVADYKSLVELNPFMKPRVYNTRIELAGDPKVHPGDSLQLEAKVVDWNPKFGDATFKLDGDSPEGMEFDTITGLFTWKPAEGLAFADFNLTVEAMADGLEQPVKSPVVIKYARKNESPQVEAIETQTAILGVEKRIGIKATDEATPATELAMTLEGAPEGAAIDGKTKELVWTPGEGVQIGELSFSLKVTDADGASTSIPIKINVQDDTARFTFLTTSFAVDAIRQAWLHDKSTNKKLILQEGETINYANIDGNVKKIEDQFVLLEIKEETWRLDLGKNLTELKKQGSAAKTDPAVIEKKADLKPNAVPSVAVPPLSEVPNLEKKEDAKPSEEPAKKAPSLPDLDSKPAPKPLPFPDSKPKEE